MFKTAFGLGVASGLILTGIACGLVGACFAAAVYVDPGPGALGSVVGMSGVVVCFRVASEVLESVKP